LSSRASRLSAAKIGATRAKASRFLRRKTARPDRFHFKLAYGMFHRIFNLYS
jgi:hypothetical protein